MCFVLSFTQLYAVTLSWTGTVDQNWSNTVNWDPDGTPSASDDIIISTFSVITNQTTIVDQNFSIRVLFVNHGNDVHTVGNSLLVAGVPSIGGFGTSIDEFGSTIFVYPNPGGPGFQSSGVRVGNNGASLTLLGEVGSTAGGYVRINADAANAQSLDVEPGGSVGGHGTIELNSLFAPATMRNSGVLFVSARPSASPPAGLPGTLSIVENAFGDPATIDLDGVNEDGFVDVDDNGFANESSLTLNIDVPLADSFSGHMSIGNSDIVNITNAWEMNTGGASPAVLNFNGTGIHLLSGGALTVNGATTQVNLNGGATGFVSGMTFNDGQFTLANNATVQFNGTTTFADATDITNGNLTTIIVASSVNIGDGTVVAGEDFNWDGNLFSSTTIVNPAGQLNINVENIDVDGTDTFNGTITMNSGNMNVQVSGPLWIMDGILNISNTASDVPKLTGDAVQIGNDDSIATTMGVEGSGLSRLSAPTTFMSDARVDVAAGAFLETTGATTFQSVNGADNAQFTGAGTWRLAGTNTINEATTINMTGGSVDLDNSSTTATVANDTFVNAPLTINAANLLTYGTLKNNGGSLSSSDLTVSHFGVNTGMLTVNTTASSVWTVNNDGTLILFNDNTEATLLAGSALLFLDGALNVTGDVRTDARLQIEGTVNINTPGEPFRLSGGNLTGQPNTIVSGTIHGPGILGADTGTMLRGNGVINASIDFDGTAELRADDGTLTVNGAILDANIVGTFDDDGILNVTNPWNMSGTVGLVQLFGGELRGGAVTTAGFGILGQGLVSAPVVNNTAISANSASGTLLVQTAANNNDWDGTTDTGQLNALAGNLEIRDNVQFAFTGTASAGGGYTFFANGFALTFSAGSTLNLDAGTYRSTNSTFINGTLSVGAGGGTLLNDQVLGFVFQGSSQASLAGQLRLEAVTTVNAGAAFNGVGELVNLSTLRLLDDAIVGVRLENQNALEIGGTSTGNIGQVSVSEFVQTADGELFLDLGGTTAGNFDFLDLGGAALLAGALGLRLTGGYVPAVGQGITFMHAELGATGTFASVVQPTGMPAGLMFLVQYAAKDVSLKVVAAPQLIGDYNINGIVDAPDYVVWRKTLGQIGNLPADGNGNGQIDPGDLTVWRANFGQSASGVGGGAHVFAEPAIPEPASVWLMIITIFAAIGRGRRGASRANGNGFAVKPPSTHRQGILLPDCFFDAPAVSCRLLRFFRHRPRPTTGLLSAARVWVVLKRSGLSSTGEFSCASPAS
jgi:hypothetical protein